MEEHRKTVTKLAEKGVVVMRASNNKPTLGIIDSIKELQEMEDEPDNEQCPPSFDEDSIGRKPEHLNCSEEDASDRNLLSALQESNKPGDHDSFLEIGNRNTPQLSTHSTYKYIVNEHTTFEDLKEANSKLLKDNQKMFRECMRLRKIVGAQDATKTSSSTCNMFKKNNIMTQSEVEREQGFDSPSKMRDQILERERRLKILKKQLIGVKKDNGSLKSQLQFIKSEKDELHRANQLMSSMIETLKAEKKHIQVKMNELSNQFQQSMLVDKNRSNLNHTNLTDPQTRRLDYERKMTNMKIVYEAQLKKKQAVIDQLQLEMANMQNVSRISIAL